jgi:D-arabinose 1-dehydrogenase-like Zn-dependent alcohol dehydrogenase
MKQGLRVVAIDGRESPLDLARSQKLSPDLAINASTTPAEDVLKQIDAMRPEGWTKGSGVDGAYIYPSQSIFCANRDIAMIMATSALSAFPYALSILKPFSLILMTAGTPDLNMPILDLIFKGLTIIGTKNGTAQDLEEATALCVEHDIRSQVRTFEFTQEGMDRLVEETHESGWAGKAVVVM